MNPIRQFILETLVPMILASLLTYCLYCFYEEKFDPTSVRGRRVLVTGASSGIGTQVAYKYAALGAKLVISARRAHLLEQVARKCLELGAEVVYVEPADMSVAEDRLKLIAAVERHFDHSLDFLILNHAILHFASWKMADMGLLERMMELNFLSYVHIASGLTPAVIKTSGHIGVVSSIAGKIGSIGASPYCASKHALHGFFSALRQEFRFRKQNVSVTFMVFGPIASERALEVVKDLPIAEDFSSMAGSVEDAAEVLVKAVGERQYEVHFPRSFTVMATLYSLFPVCVEDFGTSMMPADAEI